jgi:uncharacterized protein YkwD
MDRLRLTPTTVRTTVLAVVLIAAIAAGAARARGETALTADERSVLAAMNRARADDSEPPLGLDPRLIRAAREHAARIASSGRFAHGRFWIFIQKQGIASGRLGETLGWSAPSDGAASRIVSAWLASPEHRAILLGRYDTVGIGLLHTTFQGHADAVVVAADYRAPS